MVDKEEYYRKLEEMYENKHSKKPWNLEKIIQVINILKSCQLKRKNNLPLSSDEKYYSSKYDLIEISVLTNIILKTKQYDNILIHVTPIEEFHNKIDETHIIWKKNCTVPRVAVGAYIR